MHEISLVQGLFNQLHDLAVENRATRVVRVTMEIGLLSGVVVDSFQFGFDILSAEDELLKGARLEVMVPPVSYRCSNCPHIITGCTTKPDECPACGELLLIPDGGDDLILKQVEME